MYGDFLLQDYEYQLWSVYHSQLSIVELEDCQ